MGLFRLVVCFALISIALAEKPAGERELRDGIRRALFVSESLPALQAEKHGTFEPEPGIVAERISYATQFGMRVPAIL